MNLKDILNSKAITQREFAEALETREAVISLWITGKRMPQLRFIKKISAFLNVDIETVNNLLKECKKEEKEIIKECKKKNKEVINESKEKDKEIKLDGSSLIENLIYSEKKDGNFFVLSFD